MGIISAEQFKMEYSKDLKINFRDIDSFNHVNNGVYFQWFENARVDLTMRATYASNISNIPITMANIGCQFLIPIKFEDQIRIEAGISKISTKSFELTYRVHEKSKGLCAVGTSIQVYFDHQLMQSCPIPPNIRNQLENLSILKS